MDNDVSNDIEITVWRTLLGRAAMAFYVEANQLSYFKNDEYLQKLCDVENAMSKRYARVVLFSFAFSVFGLAAAHDVLGDFEFRGFTLAGVPFLLEFCILVLGSLISIQVTVVLDILSVYGMRRELFRNIQTEVPNMRMVHLKGNSAWADIIAPKFLGPRSPFIHRIVNWITNLWSNSIVLSFLTVPTSAQLICFISINAENDVVFSRVLSGIGLFFSAISIAVLFLTVYVPLPFKYQVPKKVETRVDGVNEADV